MKKTITIAAALLTTLTLTACGSKSSDKAKTDSSMKTEKTESATSSSASSTDNKQTKETSLVKFDKITTGNLKSGVGGTSEAKVKELLGSSTDEISDDNSNSTVNVNGKTESKSLETATLSWDNADQSLKGANITVDFVDGKAVTKSFSNFANSASLSQAKYQDIKTGDMYTTIKGNFGTPMVETESGTGSTSKQTLKYKVGTKNATLKFKNMKLTQKNLA